MNGDIPPSRTSTSTFALRPLATTLPGTDAASTSNFDSDGDGVAETAAIQQSVTQNGNEIYDGQFVLTYTDSHG